MSTHLHLANDQAPCGCGTDWAAARTAIKALLEKSYRVDIVKALDPLVDADFVTISQAISDELYAISGPLEKSHVASALQALDVDWENLSDAQRAQAVHAANVAMQDLPAKVAPKVETKLRVRLKDVARNTKVSASKNFDVKVKTSLDATDQRTVNAVANIGQWVTDEYGRRTAMFLTGVDRAVQAGLAEGLRSEDIAQELQKLGAKASVNQPKNYWNLVALNLSNRARNYGHLRSMSDAGVVNYVFYAVMDERTSLICRQLHETVFPVQTGLANFQQLELDSFSDFTAADRVMPYVKEAKINGTDITQLYIAPPGMGRTVLGEAVGSAVGQADVRGKFQNTLGPGELAAAGVSVPPLHHACRSTILPDI